MQNPKIRLIITALAPEPVYHHGKTGGDVRIAEILRRLDKKDNMDIFCVVTPYNRKFFEKNGIRTGFRIVKSNLKFKNLTELCLKSAITIFKAFFVLKRDFLRGGGKKIVVYSTSDLFWETIPAFFFKTRNKNIQWIQVIHHIYPSWKKRPGSKIASFFGYYLQRFSFWLIKKKADKIIVVNNIVKEHLIRLGFYEKKIALSSNGIDAEYFGNIKGSGSAYDGVCLGRLSPSKGFADLAEIWKNVCRELPQAKLAIIGGGDKEKKCFQKKIAENKLEKNIDLLGYLENEKAHPILKSGKVFLFPSHEEGWGIAAAEAMACGLPVVSWDLPNYKEIFENYTIQIEENSTDLFSNKVLELLKNDEMRKKIGENGKEFIKKYSWEGVAKKELEIIAS